MELDHDDNEFVDIVIVHGTPYRVLLPKALRPDFEKLVTEAGHDLDEVLAEAVKIIERDLNADPPSKQ